MVTIDTIVKMKMIGMFAAHRLVRIAVSFKSDAYISSVSPFLKRKMPPLVTRYSSLFSELFEVPLIIDGCADAGVTGLLYAALVCDGVTDTLSGSFLLLEIHLQMPICITIR